MLQALDTLGAGFSLASHDLDIRGAGNLLGEEQSGEVREVGIELYQDMLEEAVATLRGTVARIATRRWSPQINLGFRRADPGRLRQRISTCDWRSIAAYRRLRRIDAIGSVCGAELIDRFGPMPAEVKSLMKIVVDQAAVPHRASREDRRRPQGRDDQLPQQRLPAADQSSSAGSRRTRRSQRCRPDQKLVHDARVGHAGRAPDGRGAGARAKLAEMVG